MAINPTIKYTQNGVGVAAGYSRDDLVLNAPVTCSDPANGDAHTYSWTFLSIPSGSAAVISTPVGFGASSASFTPDIAGSYYVKCVVDAVASSASIAAVKTANLAIRVPALGETFEFGAKGWHPQLERALNNLDLTVQNPFTGQFQVTGSISSQYVTASVGILNSGNTNILGSLTASAIQSNGIVVAGNSTGFRLASQNQGIVQSGGSALVFNDDGTIPLTIRSAGGGIRLTGSISVNSSITGSGRLAVGGTDAAAPFLYVKGTADNNAYARIDSGDGTGQTVFGSSNASGNSFIGSLSANGVEFRTNNLARLTIATTGPITLDATAPLTINGALTGTGASFSAGVYSNVQTLSLAGTVTPDAGAANLFILNLTGSAPTIAAPKNLKAGWSFSIKITQDATGGRTVNWNTVYKFNSGSAPTLTVSGSAIDVISGVCFDGTNLLCSFLQDVR